MRENLGEISQLAPLLHHTFKPEAWGRKSLEKVYHHSGKNLKQMKHGMIPRKTELLMFRFNHSLWDGKKVESTLPFSKKKIMWKQLNLQA